MTAVFHNDTELEIDVLIYLTAELIDGHWRFSDVVIVSGENTGDGCLSENTWRTVECNFDCVSGDLCIVGVLNNYTLDGLVPEIERQRFGQERRKKTQGNDRELLINAVLLTGILSGC